MIMKKRSKRKYEPAKRAAAYVRWRVKQGMPPVGREIDAPARMEVGPTHGGGDACALCGDKLTYRKQDPPAVVVSGASLVMPGSGDGDKRPVCPHCASRADVRPYITV